MNNELKRKKSQALCVIPRDEAKAEASWRLSSAHSIIDTSARLTVIPDHIDANCVLLFEIAILTRTFTCVCTHVCVHAFICTRAMTTKQEAATSFLH